MNATASIDIEWKGPYAWPGTHCRLPPTPALPGAYLLTVDYQNGYLIYAAGITRRTIAKRLREHTRHYTTGVYNVLDIQAMQSGRRTVVWQGFWMRPRAPEKTVEYEARRIAINEAVRRQLEGFRVFVANIGTQPRILERVEAALMAHLYAQPPPFCDIPDKGMMLAPRWTSEAPISINNTCHHVLHTLPPQLVV